MILYFSNVTQYTHRFAQRLHTETLRIPITGDAPIAAVTYLLITPTYGDGRHRRMVPHQVARFLRDETNRNLCVGVVASGNRTFGPDFGRAGDVIAERLGVPLLHKFELAGNIEDTQIVCAEMERLCPLPL